MTVWKWIQIYFTFFLVIKKVIKWIFVIRSLQVHAVKKFLEIKVDNKFTFEEHIEGLCKKASQKVSAVARISFLMRFEQRQRIVNLFITSHFSYYPLVWMFHNRCLNNRIDHIYGRAYQGYNSSFKELFRKRQLLNINVLIKCQKQKSFRILWKILLTTEAATGNVLHRPQTATLLKTRLWHRWFSVNFTKFLKICNDCFCIEIWQITCYLKDLRMLLKTL